MFRKLTCLLILATSSCFAGPSVMGIEIGVDSIEKVKEKYQVLGEFTLECFDDPIVNFHPGKDILPKQEYMRILFDKNEIVNGIILGFTPDTFDTLCGILNQKYEFLQKEALSSGGTAVVFLSDDTRIMLSQNSIEENAVIFYTRKDLVAQMERSFNQKTQQELLLRLRESL